MEKQSQKNSEDFFNEIYKFSCSHFLTLHFFVLLTTAILPPLLPVAVSFILTASNVTFNIIVKVILLALYSLCIGNVSLMFIRDKFFGRNEKYKRKLLNKFKQNHIFKASQVKQLIKEKDYLLIKSKKERNLILKILVNFFKLIIVPAALSLYNLLTPYRALMVLTFLFLISIEFFIFCWKNFDYMKLIGIKNIYKYTQVQYELEFAEESFKQEEEKLKIK
ncbi:hypothetical protein LQF61_06630 [Tetragenococcus koreensis]|uniref:hypothetical protein n=1 Tax=Tetragenococcus koreensis TaxID=290335 RepID=UPI001F1C61C8|nr:hypothetical protein [Tetragenococcus koreensis]MCF1585345.1 hypothetical protein [Tetragenococcus koreensis]MCF1619751.1 hypothetical protein [Tetragenococcus koreensis]MCF1629602.1 hypothetical protein [Tetragenococcus koreensis]MCF1657234.1 hypothetical protein [Tetragenococcus koreensis]